MTLTWVDFAVIGGVYALTQLVLLLLVRHSLRQATEAIVTRMDAMLLRLEGTHDRLHEMSGSLGCPAVETKTRPVPRQGSAGNWS